MLATARVPALDGNLLHLHARDAADASRAGLRRPRSSRTATACAGKLAYLVRLVRGMYLPADRARCSSSTTRTCRSTSRRTGAATTVVQVWHAAGALKRFGRTRPRRWPSRSGRSCIATTTWSWSAARHRDGRTPRRSGRRSSGSSRSASPRTDFFFDADGAGRRARPGAGRVSGAAPAGRVVLYAPTFRGRGHRQAGGARARRGRPPGGAAGRPRPRPQDPPEPRPGDDRDRRLRRRGRSGHRDQRPARRDRHPRHRLLVVDLRVRAAAPAARAARRRPGRVRARSRACTSTTGPR